MYKVYTHARNNNSLLNLNRRINYLIYIINHILTINSSNSTIYLDVYKFIILTRTTILYIYTSLKIKIIIDLKYKTLFLNNSQNI